MHIIKNCVLLLKAEKEKSDDKYEVMLTEQGFTVKYLKTLEFLFTNLSELQKKLENPEQYSGIIFTTPRSVEAIKKSIKDANINSAWKRKKNYVVGETTHNLVLKELELICKGQDSGNANNLADVILNDQAEISKPLLFPCGNLKTDQLIKRLSDNQIEVEIITVYETVTSRTLNEDIHELTLNFTQIPEYFVYFSPSGVQSTVEYINKFECETDLIKFIAIGPTTENALRKSNIQVKSVALKPTPRDLLSAILN